MKIFILISSILFINCQNKHQKNATIGNISENYTNIDSLKSEKSSIIVKAKATAHGIGDKYIHTKIKIIDVIKNPSNIKLSDTITILNYSWKRSIPINKTCTVYLTKSFKNETHWMILNGDGDYACECE